MLVFVDTNILIDVLGRRQPFYPAAAAVWTLAETGRIQAFISTISFNNTYYIVRKLSGRAKAAEAVRLLRGVFRVTPFDEQILHQAIDADIKDFEDAVQYFSALRAQAGHLITRNPDDFPASPMSVLSAEEFLAALSMQSPTSTAGSNPPSPQPESDAP